MSLEDHFMCVYPRLTLKQLKEVNESGIYTVLATITSLADDTNWFFNECVCKGSLVSLSNSLFCETCARFVFDFLPRYKVKIIVKDLHESATSCLLDRDAKFMVGCSVHELFEISPAGLTVFAHSKVLDALVNKMFLFKVAVKIDPTDPSPAVYSIRRLREVNGDNMFRLPLSERTHAKYRLCCCKITLCDIQVYEVTQGPDKWCEETI
ncbi:hypothetical protein RIF29_03402 [Crotalaria pallida]|uniref:Replication factor A C-terminal domain-containing protein n=1 Tax=Crotalaria pallida TaxID=3830 RepID=A0AAN9J0S2_CROPI